MAECISHIKGPGGTFLWMLFAIFYTSVTFSSASALIGESCNEHSVLMLTHKAGWTQFVEFYDPSWALSYHQPKGLFTKYLKIIASQAGS